MRRPLPAITKEEARKRLLNETSNPYYLIGILETLAEDNGNRTPRAQVASIRNFLEAGKEIRLEQMRRVA